MDSLYSILGIDESATQEEIKRAWKIKANDYHPDKNIDAENNDGELFKESKRAYDVLNDPLKRKIYDDSNTDDVDPIFYEAVVIISQSITGIISTFRGDINNCNVLLMLKNNMKQYKHGLDKAIISLKDEKNSFEKISRKLTNKTGGANIFHIIFSRKIDDIQNILDELDHKIVVWEKMMGICEDHSFNDLIITCSSH